MSEFIIMTSSANMPSSCKGRYRNIAVVEVEDGVIPKMISSRAKGLIRIVEEWRACHVGTTERAEYQRSLKQAEALLETLKANKGKP